VLFSGRVQGVGFRFTVQSISAHHQVRGYVRNLPDGRVELVAEGTVDDVDRFVVAVREAMSDNITRCDLNDAAATGEFNGFSVAR